MNAVLLSTYELGRQPFGLASAAAWLERAGADVTMQDLSVCALDERPIQDAGFVGVYVPMHTATRLAEQLLPRIRRLNAAAYVVCFGLYATLNADRLREVGADAVIGGEFEAQLADAYRSVASGRSPRLPEEPVMERLRFEVPRRGGLPALDRYARLQVGDEPGRVTGYTEATRGCKHRCRHCPIVPVYGGRFVVVDPEVVLADVRSQVAAGARHITFGDPDFLNGPAHARRIVRALHEEHPGLTYDVTIKVEHLRRHADLLGVLRDTGCVLVTTAVESFDPAILDRFDKGHTAEDVAAVVAELRRIELAVNPTFVAFTPWTTVDGYLAFLNRVAELDLVGHVAPIQYAIRLLIPAGSRLLDLDDVRRLVDPFDTEQLLHPWRHPDPAMDALAELILAIVRAADDKSRTEVFAQIWRAARSVAPVDASWPVAPPLDEAVPVATVPYLTEPWYC